MTQLITIIAPPRRWLSVNWRELWRYRDLFIVLAWRDISVRYKQTVFGVAWAVFQPVSAMIIFTFIFNRVAKIESGDGTPYPVFLYTGMLLWQYFAGILTKASNALVANAYLLQKVYFPRAIIPATTVVTGLVELGIAAVVLAGLMLWYGCAVHWLGLVIENSLQAGNYVVALGSATAMGNVPLARVAKAAGLEVLDVTLGEEGAPRRGGQLVNGAVLWSEPVRC